MLLSALLVWSSSNATVALAAGESDAGTIATGLTATLTSGSSACVAGDTVTFTVSVDNQSKSKFDGMAARPSVADPALSSAVSGQLGLIDLDSVDKGKSVTKTFSVKIPKDLLATKTEVRVDVATKKKGSVQLKVPLTINSFYRGVALTSAADDGTELSGYAAQYSKDVLKVRFGLLNYDGDKKGYSYGLCVVAHKVSGDDGVDITDKLSTQWTTPLPGASSDAVAGDGSAEGSTAAAGVVNLAFDPKGELGEYNSYEVALTVKDATGNETTQSTELFRSRTNLDSVTWTFRDDTAGNKTLTRSGTAWFRDLYYGNVARDPRVPFNDAASLRSYLASFSTVKEAQDALEKNIWDLIEPHLGVSGDSALGWPKDGSSPYHRQLSSTVEKMGTYIQSEAGVVYDDQYFENLSKTAGPDLGDDNTDRAYKINLHAKTNPIAYLPAVYVFMIPTHWQMFDKLHATAQSGGKTDGGSILTAVDEMAYLYDIKQAVIRFSDYLKSQGSNAAVSVVNTQHGGDYSIVTNGGYFTTNMDDLAFALTGWDSFGDCEHVHWSTNAMQAAIRNLPTELASWRDADGVPVDLNNVVKTVVAIGGPTENKTGGNGYQSTLDGTASDKPGKDDKTEWDNIDYLYGIRTDTGTTEVQVNGRNIYSWLDNEKNQKIIQSHNSYYTTIDDPNNPAYSVCTSEDAIYDQLVKIYEQSGRVSNTTKYGVIDNATVSDTVTDEFEVKGVTATWKDIDGNVQTSRWTPDGGTAVDPSDPSADHIDVTVNADGTTSVSCNFGTLKGTGTVDVVIDAVAKADYFGSNNVKTNTGVPKVSWSHTKKEMGKPDVKKDYDKDFKEEPSVNVLVLEMVATGGKDSGRVGTSFNLKEHAAFDSGELLDGRYDQLNGKLTLSWVEVDADGSEVPVADDPAYSPVSYDVVNGSVVGSLELPSCTVNSGDAVTRNFRLKISYDPEDAVNGLVPVGGKNTFASVEITWSNTLGLSVLKVDADDKSPLSGVSFELRADDGDGAFDPASDQLASVWSDQALTQVITGSITTGNDGKANFYGLRPGVYWVKETSVAAGYQIGDGVLKLRIGEDGHAYLTGANGQEAEVNVTDNVASITIENKKVPSIPGAGSVGRLALQALSFAMVFVAVILAAGSRRSRLGDGL